MHISTGTKFRSTTSEENFCPRVDVTCKTTNVIYLIDCSRCKKPAVGETENALYVRLNSHRLAYTWKRPDKPEVHFNTSGLMFEDVKIIVIKQMGLASTARWKRRECFLIYTLRTVALDGMNLELGHSTTN